MGGGWFVAAGQLGQGGGMSRRRESENAGEKEEFSVWVFE